MEDTRKKKKIKAETVFIVAVLLIIVAVIEGTTYRKIIPANQPKVVVILPGDINDQSWNKGNYEGILANQNKDKKIDLEYQSNVEEKDFDAVIRRYAEDNYNLIILAGSQFEEVVSSVSGDYPKVDFCILNGRSASGKNTFSVYPKEEEASHLAGIIGGNLTKTGAFGVIAGYPVVDVKVTLYDGSYHEVDSSEMAFKIAGSMAFKDAMRKADPIITEPIMKVAVIVPDEYLGDVIGDLNSRRGQIQGMEAMAGTQRVNAFVPLAQMFGYATDLRSKTQGRGQYVMEPSHYEPVPKNIADQIIAGRTKA